MHAQQRCSFGSCYILFITSKLLELQCFKQVKQLWLYQVGHLYSHSQTKHREPADYPYVGVLLLQRGRWLVQKAVDVPPLEDVVILLGSSQLHIDFRSSAPQLLIIPTHK